MATFPNAIIQTAIVSSFALDGGAMFGVVPRPLWSKVHPPDERGRIEMVSRILVARFPNSGRIVVVDSGMGQHWNEKDVDRFSIGEGLGGLRGALATLDIEPHQVTDAIMTHLHFDHAGGWLEETGDFQLEPVLPNAVHHVQRDHLTWALNPTERDRGSFLPGHIEAIERLHKLNLLDGEGEVFEGLEVIVSNGHTPGMQIPLIQGRDALVAYPSDLIPTLSHGNLPWIMAYDLQPLESLREKKKLLTRAHAEQWTLVFEHDPVNEAARVKVDGSSFLLETIACPREI